MKIRIESEGNIQEYEVSDEHEHWIHRMLRQLEPFCPDCASEGKSKCECTTC